MPILKAKIILKAIAVFLPETRFNRCGQNSYPALNWTQKLLYFSLADSVLNISRVTSNRNVSDKFFNYIRVDMKRE